MFLAVAEGWTRWPLKAPPNLNSLWFCELIHFQHEVKHLISWHLKKEVQKKLGACLFFIKDIKKQSCLKNDIEGTGTINCNRKSRWMVSLGSSCSQRKLDLRAKFLLIIRWLLFLHFRVAEQTCTSWNQAKRPKEYFLDKRKRMQIHYWILTALYFKTWFFKAWYNSDEHLMTTVYS